MLRHTQAMTRRARQKRYSIMVSRVVRTLPAEVQAMLDSVAILVEIEPSLEHLSDSNLAHDDALYGLYQGVPLIDRGSAYSLVTPDQITIFVGALVQGCETRRELDEQIRITILHELGHHIGFDEDGLELIGLT
jgi:predicted Zn-dependent protease with MMP-like domain